MEKILNIMIELGLLYEEEEQKLNNKKNEEAILNTAKLFLDSKRVTIEEVKHAMLKQEYIEKFGNMNDLIGLLNYMEWTEKQKAKKQ